MMDSALSLAGKPLAPAGEKDPAVADNPASTLNKFLIEAKTGKVGNDVFATLSLTTFLTAYAGFYKTHSPSTPLLLAPNLNPAENIQRIIVPKLNQFIKGMF